MRNQIFANETGYCKFRISNIGNNIINITDLKFSGYYNETVQIQDIQAKVNSNVTTGIEPSETLFNVSVRLANSVSTAYSGTLWLNITNSSGYVVNYSSQSINVLANSVNIFNFTNISTSGWSEGTYTLKAFFD